MNRGGLTRTPVFYESKKYGKFGALKKSSSHMITEAKHSSPFHQMWRLRSVLCPAKANNWPRRETAWTPIRAGVKPPLYWGSGLLLTVLSKVQGTATRYSPSVFLPRPIRGWGCGEETGCPQLWRSSPLKLRKQLDDYRCILLLRFYNVLKSGGTRKINHIILPQDINRHSYNC